ncbi:hypothetical protein ACQEVB_39055 [Pseudonocardia sp. CA-107938]|uniref:hypothetical protein n=1 Tax=Pseudonocardia sp. CA-107938 TaxID=3240021 RepID=UPI003D8C8A75
MLKVVFVDPAASRGAVAALCELDRADGEPLQVALVGSTDEAGTGRFAGYGPALDELHVRADDGLTITADAARAAEARDLGLPVVQVGVDVPDWSAVPPLVAHLLDPEGVEQATFERSLRAHGQIAEPGVDAVATTHHVDSEGRIRRDRFASA